MNQNRVMLFAAWLIVAVFLWMQWGKETSPDAVPKQQTQSASVGVAHDPDLSNISVPQAPTTAVSSEPTHYAEQQATPAYAPAPAPVQVKTDVLDLILDGRSVYRASLPEYPESLQPGAKPVVLLTDNATHPYTVVSGWASNTGSPVPGIGFRLDTPQTNFQLANGQKSLIVPFVWHGPNGVTIQRTYTFDRGRYAIIVRDTITNHGNEPWNGYIFRKLSRVPLVLDHSVSNPDSFSFNGAVWYSHDNGYQRRAFKDYLDDGKVNATISGGWAAFLQHHFFTAWIPQSNQTSLYVLDQDGSRDVVEERGPEFTVGPGQTAQTQAILWIGPKLVSAIDKEHVPGLNRVVDYSRFSLMALIGQGLFWILSHLHSLFGNWGWSIIGLVVLLRIVMYPLTAAQYASAAKLRKFQPRLQQLKERYGQDRQKLQAAMMELYRKEKINPMGGCLPVFVQMPIFFSLYWVLVESVELRQAPWLGWIHDLTARDPYFILPALNIAIMWATQRLTPTPAGMDPMSAKIMQFMPLMFGVMMAFVPSGLALYWVVNGGLNLLIQWWMIRRHGESPAKIMRISN